MLNRKQIPVEKKLRLQRRHVRGALVRSGASVSVWAIGLIFYSIGTVEAHQFSGISASVLYLILMNIPTILILKYITGERAFEYFSLFINQLEIIGYTAIIYFCGGIEASFLTLTYAALIAYVGVAAPGTHSYIIACLCAINFSLMVGLVHFGLLPKIGVNYNSWFYGIISVVSGLLLVIAFISGTTANLLRSRRDELNYKNREMARANQQLAEEIEVRKQAVKEFGASEERYRDIIESIEEGYFELDLNGNFTFVNPSLGKIGGYTYEELLGMNNRDYSSPETSRRMYKVFSEIYRTGVPSVITDYEVIKKDGSKIICEVSASLIWDKESHPTGFRGVVRNITERKKIEEELRLAKEGSEAANRAKSEFLATMSHEIRTPLNHMIGFTELVADKDIGPLNEEQEEYLGHVLDSSQHLLSLINDILDLSKVESGKMELEPTDVDLESLLENSLVLIREKAINHRIQVSTEIDEIPQLIYADERKLKQIMYNLLYNAVKFTQDGGKIHLKAKYIKDFRNSVIEGLDQSSIPQTFNSLIQISLADNGIGIKQEFLGRIFRAFEQGDSSVSRQYQGTGLGLSLTRRLVELHGGSIWVESEGEDKGSTFHFVIPADQPR